MIKLFGYNSDEASFDERYLKPVRHNKPKTALLDKCCYCECKLTDDNRTKDHVWPRSKGGKGKSFRYPNIKPCCVKCNQEKSDLLPLEYIKWLYSQAGIQSGMLLATKIYNVQRIIWSCLRKK